MTDADVTTKTLHQFYSAMESFTLDGTLLLPPSIIFTRSTKTHNKKPIYIDAAQKYMFWFSLNRVWKIGDKLGFDRDSGFIESEPYGASNPEGKSPLLVSCWYENRGRGDMSDIRVNPGIKVISIIQPVTQPQSKSAFSRLIPDFFGGNLGLTNKRAAEFENIDNIPQDPKQESSPTVGHLRKSPVLIFC